MLTPAQLLTLKNDIIAKGAPGGPLAPWYPGGQWNYIAAWYNETASPSFTVWKTNVTTDLVGKTVNYIAVEAMTTANQDRIKTFYVMNPSSFDPSRTDIQTFWSNTFSGALGGQGQATRDALTALWKRLSNNVEKLFATGTGSNASPGSLVYEGTVTNDDIVNAMSS